MKTIMQDKNMNWSVIIPESDLPLLVCAGCGKKLVDTALVITQEVGDGTNFCSFDCLEKKGIAGFGDILPIASYGASRGGLRGSRGSQHNEF